MIKMEIVENTRCNIFLSLLKIKWVFNIILVMLSVLVYGQNPGWTPPVGSGYSYSASVISFVSLNGTRSNDGDDRIAFFLGEELKGLSKPVSMGNGQYIHFITLFSNTDAVFLNIKIYHKNTDQVYDVLSPFQFRVQKIYGSIDDPYEMNIYTSNNAPFSITGVPLQQSIEGLEFVPINMAAYLVQPNPNPVEWSFVPNPNLVVNFVGNVLYAEGVPGFTGQTQLIVRATEQNSGILPPHSAASTRNIPLAAQMAETVITFNITALYAVPAWHNIPPQGILLGGTFTPVNLHDYEYQFGGPSIVYSYLPVIEEQIPADPKPIWETSTFFSSNMNITMRLDYTPKYQFQHAEDLLAAYVNGEVRGVAKKNVSTGLYYLSVGGSIVSGDSITLKFYSGAMKKIFTKVNAFIYRPYNIEGNSDYPIIIDLAPIIPVVPSGPIAGGYAVMPILIADSLFTGTVRFEFSAADALYPEYLRAVTQTSFCVVSDASGLTIQFEDSDGDGLGDPDRYITACFNADGYVNNGDDCDDNQLYDPAINLLISENSGYASNDGIVCSGSMAMISASGGTNYLWSNGQTMPGIFPSVMTDSTFFVTVTFTSGCKGVANATIKTEGKMVTNPGDIGYGSLRSIVSCAMDGDTITYDQPSVSSSALISQIFVNNTILIEGLNNIDRPVIFIDFSQNSHGFLITSGKSLTLKNMDMTTLNNNLSQPVFTGNGTVIIDGLVKIKDN